MFKRSVIDWKQVPSRTCLSTIHACKYIGFIARKIRYLKQLASKFGKLLIGILMKYNLFYTDENKGGYMNMMSKTSATKRLKDHAKRFEKRVEKVTDGVYSAIGFGLANSILLVTDIGNIIVDTTESITAAEEIKNEFDKISPLKTVAIIYTHGHTDHVRGASVFMEDHTEVYAQAKTKDFFHQQFNQLEPILTKRGARQFGVRVPKEHLPSSGLGPFLRMDRKNPEIIMPTKEFEESLELTIGNLELQLVAAPGETDDHIFVWLPEKKVLLSADNYYPCFPNLYTIRGTTPRPVFQWIHSLDKMRQLDVSFMVPSHAEPVYGEERIQELLTVYRDAIQYIHDAVVRGMNEGKTPDELVEEIRLPQSLLQYDELAELYGDISQAIRSIFDGYLGWFDGNATNLVPLLQKERAEHYIELAGGFDHMLTETSKAISSHEYQWAAELCDHLLAVCPDNQDVMRTKAEALFGLGFNSANSNNRAYYLTQAMEIKGDIVIPTRTKEIHYAFAKNMSIEQFFLKMNLLLHPVKSENENRIMNLHIIDENKWYQLHIRRGILDVQPGVSSQSHLEIETTADIWKRLVLGLDDISACLNNKLITIQGEESFKEVIQLFR